jgi:uncharacterized metal-binding protein
MDEIKDAFVLEVRQTKARCPVGETVGNENLVRERIPVLSCEGACIRGEIARIAANLVAKEDPYRRACHGELFAVPDSAMAKWVKHAEKVVLIDGCFLRCHGRILENLVEKPKLVQFDALSHYNKYTDRFDVDSVPEEERQRVGRSVAEWVLANLAKDTAAGSSPGAA